MMPAWLWSDIHAGDLDLLVTKLADDTWSWCCDEFGTAARDIDDTLGTGERGRP
jgi:hypothetical protein